MSRMKPAHVTACIVIVAAAIRLGLLLMAPGQPQRLFTPDSEGYVRLATELVQSGRFEQDGRAEIFRTPGYPVLLIAGAPWGEGWYLAVAVAQVAMDVAVVYLVYVLGWIPCKRGVGQLAAVFYALSPLAAASSLRILSDGLFTLLWLFALLMLVFHLRTRRWWALIAGAVAMGLSAYVRPVGLAYAVVVVAVLLSQADRWRRAGAFLAVLTLAVGPWVVRNYVRADYVGFSSFASDSLYYFGAPDLTAKRDGISPAQARERAWREGHQLDEDLPPGPAAAERAAIVMDLVGSAPLEYTKVHLAGSLGFWLPSANEVLEVAGLIAGNRGTLDVLHQQGPWAAAKHYFGGDRRAMALAAVMVAMEGLMYLGVLAWVALCLRRRLGPEYWLGVAIVLVAWLIVGPSGLPRYRLPVTPLLCAAAAAGYFAIGLRVRRRRASA